MNTFQCRELTLNFNLFAKLAPIFLMEKSLDLLRGSKDNF